MLRTKHRRSDGVFGNVAARKVDEFGEVVDAEDGAARLDEQVKQTTKVARSGACIGVQRTSEFGHSRWRPPES